MKICQNCNKEFEKKTIVNGKIVWLTSRKFCTECSPLGKNNSRSYIIKIEEGKAYCARCQEQKDVSKFYTRGDGNPLSYCMECQEKVKVLKMEENLNILIESRDGCCKDCNGIFPTPVFEFYKDGKSFPIGKMKHMSLKNILKKMEEYEMICKNCCAIRKWQL